MFHRLSSLWALPLVSGLVLSTPVLHPALAPRNSDGDCHYDVIIYESTVSAVSAAIQIKRMNKTVAIVTPDTHIGGMTVSGLGWTDSKNGTALGGITREFFERIYQYYLSDSAWNQQTRASYIGENIEAQPGLAIDTIQAVQWTFEPHVAEKVINDWLAEYQIPIYCNEWLDRSGGAVEKDGAEIKSMKMLSGNTYYGKMFIDTGYNGDLMAEANVTWRIGREPSSEYNESLGGVVYRNDTIYIGIDPWQTKGDPSSGLIDGITRVIPDPTDLNGTADPFRLQAYNYRISLTQVPEIRVPFSKPDDYNETAFELLFRYTETGFVGQYFTDQYMPNNKTDSNASGNVSTDLIGANFDEDDGTNYGEWDYDRRAKANKLHESWTRGLLWTLAYHPRTPQVVKDLVSIWGWAGDEWTDNNNFPYQIYIRESRRMTSDTTVTQADVFNSTGLMGNNDSSIALGSYTADIHVVERAVTNSIIHSEGTVGVAVPNPYPIAYGSIVPFRKDATNFLNPVTLSATHVAFASIRLEPTYMILGQSAGTAAVMALEQSVSVQDIDRKALTARLLHDSQFLEWPTPYTPIP